MFRPILVQNMKTIFLGRRVEAWTSSLGGLDRPDHPDHDEGLRLQQVHERPSAGLIFKNLLTTRVSNS